MSFRLSHKLLWAGLGLGLLLLVIGSQSGQTWLLAGAVVALAAAIGQAALAYRCPHCGESLLNVRGKVPARCPHCGRELIP